MLYITFPEPVTLQTNTPSKGIELIDLFAIIHLVH